MNTSKTTCLALLVILAAAVRLGAASSTWDGGSADNANWSTAANWNNDTAPASAADTDITLAGTLRPTIELDEDFTLKTLTKSGTTAFTINSTAGKILSIYGNGSNNAVTNSSSGLFTINADIKLYGTTRFATTSGAMKLGAINLNGNNVTFNANNDVRSITLAGTISGSATLVEYIGAGTYIIESQNSYDAPTRLSNGTLKIKANNAFGSDGRQLNLGQTSTSNRTLTVLTEAAVAVNNTIVLAASTGTAHTYTVGGNTAHTSSFKHMRLANDVQNVTLNLTAATDGRVNITGNITDLETATGNGSIVKTGDGTVALSNSTAVHTYKGDTTVNAGTLLINGTLAAAGNAAVNVASTGTLGGTGSINRNVTLADNATLQIGDISASTPVTAAFTINANLALGASVTVKFDLGATQTASDSLVVNGDLALGGTLTFDLTALDGFGQAGASNLTLLSVTGNITGGNPANLITFTGADYTANYTLQINANSIQLISSTAPTIPEPAITAALFAFGALLLANVRHRKS
ncbi:autotransporter-associated beta strand repeat-containing protein [Geminisphaera colitermitum]|uniref:autotransporter-associated beta strand repeat-containing protein n=1 Tax=Geminisphaera colitermitum TaxID=1148786 RepID=UPI0005B9AA8F|nr:autotransporter-associated beta strand repeat-containing protein [Geminisphaera colitermitum]